MSFFVFSPFFAFMSVQLCTWHSPRHPSGSEEVVSALPEPDPCKASLQGTGPAQMCQPQECKVWSLTHSFMYFSLTPILWRSVFGQDTWATLPCVNVSGCLVVNGDTGCRIDFHGCESGIGCSAAAHSKHLCKSETRGWFPLISCSSTPFF